MKRITATVLFLTAISGPVLAETPTDRDMHSWGYVDRVATQAQTPPQEEAPMIEHRGGEERPYYHHESGHMGKHHGHHHAHHEGAKHKHHHHHGAHHHHHHTDKVESKGKEKPAEAPKQ